MIKCLQIAILLFITNTVHAQIGESVIATSNIGVDDLSFPAIGKTTTPKCTTPGTCNNTCIAYTFTGSGDWSNEQNWEGLAVPPPILTGCSKIIIDPKAGTECFLNIPLQIIPNGTSIIVMAGKKFRVPYNLVQEN